MIMLRARGALGAVLLVVFASSCVTEADGVEVEDVGEQSSALCSSTKLLKPAKAISNFNGRGDSAIDQNVNTSWLTVPSAGILMVDYGKVNVVSQVKLNWETTAQTYDVSISLNGIDFTLVQKLTKQPEGDTKTTLSSIDKKARFIRVRTLSQLQQAPRLAEIQALGDAATCLKADGEVCTSVAECASELCTFWYKGDADGDNYGVTRTATRVCGLTAPVGYVSRYQDCCDTDATAHPGEREGKTTKNACGSFDYDCSGKVDLFDADVGSFTCNQQEKTCAWTSGFVGSVPDCGGSGSYISGCQWLQVGPSADCAVDISSKQTQTCK